jgi:hypothetical protein
MLFITVLSLELFARYIIRQPYYAFPEGYFVNNEFYGYALAKNFIGQYSQPEFTISINTNNDGLRDRERPRCEACYRILALGDSFSFGVGVELVDTYLSILETMLNNRGDRQCNIIKAGVVGYSTYNEKIYLEKQGLNYFPHMVLVQFWWDDLGVDRITYLADTGFLTSGKIKSNKQLRLFLNRYFRSYTLLRRVFTTMFNRALFASKISNVAEGEANLEDKFIVTLKQFKDIETLCNQKHILCLFVLVPPKELIYEKIAMKKQWRSFCNFLNKNDVKYIDVALPLKNAVLKGESVFFEVSPHLNKNGHRVVAEAIYKYISTDIIYNKK